jgi:hypothetical protein
MKKSFFIIFGISIILILVAVWVYLLFFAKTEDNLGLFNNFFKGDAEVVEVEPLPIAPVEENLPVNLERPPLRQLTTRPVAGFNEVVGEGDTLEIYFVEQGTGHLYSINLDSGEERRLSGTTVVQAQEAYISSDGNTVAIVSHTNTKNKNLSLFRLDRENSSLTEVIVEVVQDFYLTDEHLFFTVAEADGLEAYAYQLDTLKKEAVFSLPFIEAKIQWGNTVSGPHYVYPKASYALQGFLYEIKDGKLTRLPLEGFGFSALVGSDTILFTKITDQAPASYLFDSKTREIKNLGFATLPEKCLNIENSLNFVCPLDVNSPTSYQMPDLWYRGKLSLSDNLIEIDTIGGTSDILVNIMNESGREIDVIKLGYNEFLATFFFTNKNDNTLWMYESFN